RRQVRAEGGRRPRGGRSLGLPDRPGCGAAALPRRHARDTDRPRSRRPGPRRRDLLRARRDGRRRDRHPDGRLVECQQVQPARRDPGRRSADGLRAAVRARGRFRGDGGGDPLADRHRHGVGAVVAAVAGTSRGGVLRCRARRAPATAVRHAGSRRRARLRSLHRVRRAAVRGLPPGRVRRHRRPVRADRGPLPRRLARPGRGAAGLAVDAAEDRPGRVPGHLGAGRLPAAARGPAAAARLAGARAARPAPAGGHRRRGGDLRV
ncbi:MAG: NADH-ubiquinone oxidoreductase chain H, partial [uncultured Nocardioidaceae bacterium]